MLFPTHAHLFSDENEIRMEIRFKEMCEKRKKTNKRISHTHDPPVLWFYCFCSVKRVRDFCFRNNYNLICSLISVTRWQSAQTHHRLHSLISFPHTLTFFMVFITLKLVWIACTLRVCWILWNEEVHYCGIICRSFASCFGCQVPSQHNKQKPHMDFNSLSS